MLGTIVGDIVGSIYEFDNHRSKDFPFFGEGADFTDDSVLTLAVADALLGGKPRARPSTAGPCAIRGAATAAASRPGSRPGTSRPTTASATDPPCA